MSEAAYTQRCRLFLEGREVPFAGASISSAVGQPTVASIDLIPVDPIKHIHPKTQVHIFVQDTYNFPDDQFYLAFEGEVTGRSLGKAQDSRYFRITATDYTTYWDEAKTFYYNHNFLLGDSVNVLSGGSSANSIAKQNAAKVTQGSATLESEMIRIITAKSNRDIIDGVAAVIKRLKNVNLFFKTAWERLRIEERLRIFSSSRITEFLKEVQIEEYLKSYLGSHGGMASLRTTLNSIMGLIFHDFVSMPFPAIVRDSKKGNTITNYLFLPDGYSLPAPKCNVIFPDRLQSMDLYEDFRAAPTRFTFKASFPEYISGEIKMSVYPAQHYPTSFGDFMAQTLNTNRRKHTDEERDSLLGPATILRDPATGKDYSTVNYGKKSDAAPGKVSVSPTLREVDFLTNEEAIRGINLASETLIPSMIALMKDVGRPAREAFTFEIGKYLFFKKRFGTRNLSARLLFHPFLLPGFNCLIVDDSDAKQTMYAKVQSVNHTLTSQGCGTTVELGYGRTFDEIDALTGGAGDPPLPAWFDPDLFGRPDAKAFQEETTYLKETAKVLSAGEATARAKIKSPTAFKKLSAFYQRLIGCDSVTDIDSTREASKICTSRGAAYYLTERFKNVSSSHSALEFVRNYVRRPIPTLKEAFLFLGATAGNTIPDEFAVFKSVSSKERPGYYDGKGRSDEAVLKIRRDVIDRYVEVLKVKRGFRG